MKQIPSDVFKQKTLKQAVSLSGVGVHSGEKVCATVHPAPENHGIVFQVHYAGQSVTIPASIENIGDDLRQCTSLRKDGLKLYTIEHVLSACYGLGITNARIECEGPEIPILDGSAKPWVDAFLAAELNIQDANAACWEITDPISIVKGDRSLMVLPSETFQITCTFVDPHKCYTQHLSLVLDNDVYTREIAPARTFCTYEEIEPLLKMGKIKGGSLDCALVIKDDKILANEPLRFSDEFVRHKMLDLMGDLALLRHPIKGHVIAIQPGHALNAELTKAIAAQEAQIATLPIPSAHPSAVLDIYGILKRLPHRYPFVMVDRVLTADDHTLVAIKNVTINEPYFAGHFPENPVLPGVLQVEAMAQAAGLLMALALGKTESNQRVFFMSADKIKFRNIVQPGDTLRIEIQLLKIKNNRIGCAEGQCSVNGKVVSSAELMFMLGDA